MRYFTIAQKIYISALELNFHPSATQTALGPTNACSLIALIAFS